jgi:hypothetical protein
VHNIAIDPLDENYFISAGTTGDPTVTVWDQRYVKQRNPGDAASSEAVLEFRPVVDNKQSATIWSLRYCGTKKGTFGVLANTGELKVIELAQHSHRPDNQHISRSSVHPRSWASQHYTKASHNLQYPYYDEPGRRPEARVVAYDFVTAGNPFGAASALALYPNKDIEILRIPGTALKINVTAMEEIYKNQNLVSRPSQSHGTIADDLRELQEGPIKERLGGVPDTKDSLISRLDKLNVDTPHRNIPLESASHGSYQVHELLLTLGFPDVKIPLPDYLKVLQTQRRRCKEGYNLDCIRNKEIVSNDPWLVEAWNLVQRMDHMSRKEDDEEDKESGMAGDILDLKYLGISAIWSNKLEMYDQRLVDPDAKTSEAVFVETVKEICEAKELPAFSGVRTAYPENRQLCLCLCGWHLTNIGLRERLSVFINEGDYYKAIVLAVFQGYKSIALDLLKETIRQKQIENIGLGAVIACDSVNEEQRELCSWMKDMTDDAYLKALLTYFISGNWADVVKMPQLALCDRVGVALKYLDDQSLSDFLHMTTTETIAYGNIEGLLLTGLTNRAMDLFEHYIAKYGDLQSAVLIMSRACPLFIQDPRWSLWRDIYLNQMQVWRAFLERTHYIKEHNMYSRTREGRSINKPSAPSLAIRCHNCQQNLALRKDPKTSQQYLTAVGDRGKTRRPGPRARPHLPKGSASSPALTCPNCNAHMPRCGICMMWLGSPDPSKVGAVQTLKEEDLEARLMVFCMSCTHGFHGHHARDWFARHAMCPVPDCQCMCGLLK